MDIQLKQNDGMRKIYWHQIRDKILKIEPVFTKLVDELEPDKSFPLYLAYYPYGVLKGDTMSTFLPRGDGTYYRLHDSDAPADIRKNLGYGDGCAPFAMLLDKHMESFIDLKEAKIVVPRNIYKPGDLFPLARILGNTNAHNYAPNGILNSTAGVRSVFLLPNIGCIGNHTNLQRDFNVRSSPPKYMYDHWSIFREIMQSKAINNNDWRACLLYFSQKWLDQLHENPAWSKLKLYLLALAWQRFDYDRHHIDYDFAFSVIQQKRNLKPNPYLVDTAQHLFRIAVGAAPGFIPALDNSALPLKELQKAYTESYNIKKYLAVIMRPSMFNFEVDSKPIYYSLQHPSTYIFSPKARKITSTLFEMHELAHIMEIFTRELANDEFMCYNTIMNKAAKFIEFSYFHNRVDPHHIIQLSKEIISTDPRFGVVSPGYELPEARFACDSPFLRGCIAIKRN